MKFLVRMWAVHPITVRPQELASLALKQLEYWDRLEQEGKVIFTAPYVGQRARVAIYEVESTDELFDLINADPLFGVLDREVISPGEQREASRAVPEAARRITLVRSIMHMLNRLILTLLLIPTLVLTACGPAARRRPPPAKPADRSQRRPRSLPLRHRSARPRRSRRRPPRPHLPRRIAGRVAIALAGRCRRPEADRPGRPAPLAHAGERQPGVHPGPDEGAGDRRQVRLPGRDHRVLPEPGAVERDAGRRERHLQRQLPRRAAPAQQRPEGARRSTRSRPTATRSSRWPSKPYTKIADLKGQKVGTPNATLLDWMIIRAAGKKAEGIDLENDAQMQAAAPGLINGLLDKGDLDAALQYSDFTLGAGQPGQVQGADDRPEADGGRRALHRRALPHVQPL